MDQDDTLDRLDIALIPLKAALNAVPIIGGPLASLISDCMAQLQQQSMKKAAEFLKHKVAELEGRIDTKAVNKEDFAELFGKYAVLTATTIRKAKLCAASNILANALLPPSDPNKSPFDELDHLMHCVNALSSGAIALLGASIQIADQAGADSRTPRPADRSAARFYFAEIRQKLPDLAPHLVLGLAAELRSLNLLHITEGAIATPDFQHYLFGVTPLGFVFAERFIEGKM